MKILKGCILIAVALTLSAMALVSCLHGGKMMSITVTPDPATMANGSTLQFTAIATLSDGQTVNWTQASTWTSSLDSTVTITNTAPSNGLATSLTTAGTSATVTITATDPINGISHSVTVNVADPTSIVVMPVNPYMGKGAVHQFTAIAIFSSPTITQDLTSSPSVTWTPDSNLATLGTTTGSFGLVTANTTTLGTVIITALDTVSGKSGTTQLTVTDTPLSYLTVSPADPIISTGTTTQFSAQGTFQDLSKTPSGLTSTWTWSSSKTAIATIDSSGLATAGTTTGTTTITATDPITGAAGITILKVQ